MTKKDVERLFELLAIYRPGDRHLEDKTLKAAWLLVLEPYAPADVKAAVGAYFRESKYWPDPSDIAMRCPRPLEAAAPERKDVTSFSAAEIARCGAQMDEMLELGELMALDYESAGVPHPAKARGMGWTCRMWMDRCREAMV